MTPFLARKSLYGFGDVTFLRDPRGRSVLRSLHLADREGEPGFFITGPFLIHQLYTVRRENGIDFVQATGDENPIHREGDVVPGAMIGARSLSTVEALFPGLRVTRLRIKFRTIARYGKRMRQQMAFSFQNEREAEVKVWIQQHGAPVAEGGIYGRFTPGNQRLSVGKWRVNKEQLRRVQRFFRSLRIAPNIYLEPGGAPNFAYPRGFLASLPSGEMVRQLSGKGGLLTSLDLNFPDAPSAGIVGSSPPEVILESGASRSRFAKIFTCIRSGVEECCKGFALVFSSKKRQKAAPDVQKG